MQRSIQKRQVKLSILGKIKQNKNILFASFSQVTKEAKREAWGCVARHARALGVVGRVGLDPVIYMRDVWWQNTKKSTLERLELTKQPDRKLQVVKKWNVIDDCVLTILDLEPLQLDPSAVTTGNEGLDSDLQELEPGEELDDLYDVKSKDGDSRSDPLEESLELPTKSDGNVQSKARPLVKSINVKAENKPFSGDNVVGKSKMELEMELLKIQIYKARLEARQLEVAMSLPPSRHTAIVAHATAATAATNAHNYYVDDISRDSFN